MIIGNNSTINIYYGSTPLLENAALNLYATSEDTNEYNELSINPNTWTDELGKEAQITNAYHEDGTITLELAFDDGTEADIAFHWFYREPELLDGAFVADKVVGKGAAALMILGGVEGLFADVVSRAALDLFAAAGKAVAYTVAVPHIINRADDGICPVERLCAEAQTAEECLPLIEGFIRKMQERNE